MAKRKRKYRVFVSHGGDDSWVAGQIALGIENCGAQAFLDTRDIAAGDNFKARIHEEIPNCDELPWLCSRHGRGVALGSVTKSAWPTC